jgi:hypothetical protein
MHTLKTTVLAGGLALAWMGCSSALNYTPRGTARAPEADARVTAEVHSEWGLTALRIRAEHLAPPGRIQPGATHYVAWARRDQNAQWMRIGTLAYSDSDRNGQLMATSPDTSFDLALTAETAASPTSPSTHVVIEQRVGNPAPAPATPPPAAASTP